MSVPLLLFGAFAAVLVVLATAGVYAVLAGSVTDRFREIGLRAALGADSGELLRILLRDVFRVSGAGVLAGLVLASGLSRALATLPSDVRPLEPSTYATVAALLLLAALAASWIPARRAARVDPAVALRAERSRRTAPATWARGRFESCRAHRSSPCGAMADAAARVAPRASQTGPWRDLFRGG